MFLAALESSLDREAERVRDEAGVALRRELSGLNSYLEQLRQMEKVLEEVADKPQTEFLMVSISIRSSPPCILAKAWAPEASSHCHIGTLKPVTAKGQARTSYQGWDSELWFRLDGA